MEKLEYVSCLFVVCRVNICNKIISGLIFSYAMCVKVACSFVVVCMMHVLGTTHAPVFLNIRNAFW